MTSSRFAFQPGKGRGSWAVPGLPGTVRMTLLASSLAASLLVSSTDAQTAALHETARPAPRVTEQEYFQRLVEKIEPGHVGSPERVEVYLRFFKRRVVNDARLFAFRVESAWTSTGVLRLTGFVEFAETRATLETFLTYLGFDSIDNQIEVLPSPNLGKRLYGFIKATHALGRAQPTADAEVATDSLLGDPVYLLRKAGNGFFLCHTAEGYLGYLQAEDIHRVEASRFRQYRSGAQVTLLADEPATTGRSLPVGARLKWLRNEGERIVVELPTGEEVSLPATHGKLRDGRPSQRVERAIENALHLLGTPYSWGGKTSAGIDCSGLVQIAFASEGINLPRDSSQQVYLGRLTATRWFPAGMRRGDTLYFLGPHGKITHTAIYLGNDQYLESAGPGVRISSLNPTDTNFDARRSKQLAFAKRLLE